MKADDLLAGCRDRGLDMAVYPGERKGRWTVEVFEDGNSETVVLRRDRRTIEDACAAALDAIVLLPVG